MSKVENHQTVEKKVRSNGFDKKVEMLQKKIVRLKQKIMRTKPDDLLYVEYQNTFQLYTSVMDSLRDLNFLEYNDNVHYTGIKEIDYLLNIIEKAKEPDGVLKDENNEVLYAMIYNHIPVRTKVLDENGRPRIATGHSPEDFLEFILDTLYPMSIIGHKNLLPARNYRSHQDLKTIWENYLEFSKINLLDKPKSLEHIGYDSLPGYVEEVEYRTKNKLYLSEFDLLLNHPTAVINEEIRNGLEDYRNEETILLLKRILKIHFENQIIKALPYEEMTKLEKKKGAAEEKALSDFSSSFLYAETEEEFKEKVGKYFNYLLFMGAIKIFDLAYWNNGGKSAVFKAVYYTEKAFHLTYTSLDKLTLILLEENAFGPFAVFDDHIAQVYSAKFKGLDEATHYVDNSIDLELIKSKLTEAFYPYLVK